MVWLVNLLIVILVSPLHLLPKRFWKTEGAGTTAPGSALAFLGAFWLVAFATAITVLLTR